MFGTSCTHRVRLYETASNCAFATGDNVHARPSSCTHADTHTHTLCLSFSLSRSSLTRFFILSLCDLLCDNGPGPDVTRDFIYN